MPSSSVILCRIGPEPEIGHLHLARAWLLVFSVALGLLSPLPAAAGVIEVPSAEEIEDAIPEGGELTGREIYERFLKNRLHSAIQHQRVVSMDPGGSKQTTRFWVRWKDYRDENDLALDGILAKTIVKFLAPFDIRHTSYLMIAREDRDHDQFIYRPSTRTVRRVNIRSVSVMGTDYSFDDIAYQNIEDAEYHRLADARIEDIPVYVVEATLNPLVDGGYYRARVHLEKEHYVPLRARYWDQAGVALKEMTAEVSSIREFGGVWVATVSTVHNLREGTRSMLFIEDLDPNPQLAEQEFSLFRLQLRH